MVALLYFTNGENFCDCLFVTLDEEALSKWGLLFRKESAPPRVECLTLGQTLIKIKPKKKMAVFHPLKVSPFTKFLHDEAKHKVLKYWTPKVLKYWDT